MRYKDERGALMLEVTYCISLAIIVLAFLLSFGFFVYQKTVARVVANEVAEEVIQTYKLRNITDSTEITSEEIKGIGKYRYIFFSSSFESKNETKVQTLTDVRLSKTALAKKNGGLTVDIETVVDDIGRRHYEVSIKQQYSFMLGDLLNAVGQDGVQMIEETVYVESVDVLNYVNTVKNTKYGLKKLQENSSTLSLINSCINLLYSIFDG
ncbi:MAG: hypothetical protein ACK5LL_13205 [Suipraeoptans sp.]